MKRINKHICLALMAIIAIGCSPDKYESLNDNTILDVTKIVSARIIPNHNQLIADGKAIYDLRPYLYFESGTSVPDYRVTDDMVEYKTASGKTLTRYYSTDDASLIGTTQEVTMQLKGTDIISEPISFKIVAPPTASETTKKVIPIVFHIVQTNDDITMYEGAYDADLINLLLEKLNNLYNGSISENPVGVNSGIEFKAAMYAPNGSMLREPGINRVVVDEVLPVDSDNTEIYKFIETANIDWSGEDYLNVWLISDRNERVSKFSKDIVTNCLPMYYNAGVDVATLPEGLTLTEYDGTTPLTVANSGVIYKLQSLFSVDRSFGSSGTPSFNDLSYYIGRYMGLLPTYSYSDTAGDDFCDDTIDYDGDKDWPYKRIDTTYYFKSENIMDDATGLHVSISKDQVKRARWILDNSPDRAAWKSDFAFTGK